MTLAATSFRNTADTTGTDQATSVVSAKAHPAFIRSGNAGHVQGSRDTYLLITTAMGVNAAAANRVHFDLFNGAASGVNVTVHGIWANAQFDVAAAPLVGLRLDLFRTTTEGTQDATTRDLPIGSNEKGWTTSATVELGSGRTIALPDPDHNRQYDVTARLRPSGGATSGAFIAQAYIIPEELHVSYAYWSTWQNLMRYAQFEDVSDLIVKPDTGFKIVQGPVASAGNLGFRVAYTLVPL